MESTMETGKTDTEENNPLGLRPTGIWHRSRCYFYRWGDHQLPEKRSGERHHI